MRVLFDHNVPDQLASLLTPHEVTLTREMGWASLVNGKLLAAAETEGFPVMVTGDKKIVKQQNNMLRKIALVVIGNTDRFVLLAHSEGVLDALTRISMGSYELVPMPGTQDYRNKLGLQER